MPFFLSDPIAVHIRVARPHPGPAPTPAPARPRRPSPFHDLRELHPGQELVVLADLPDGAFKLSPVLVDQSLPLLLLLCAALLLPKLEAEGAKPALRAQGLRTQSLPGPGQGRPQPQPRTPQAPLGLGCWEASVLTL